MTNSILAGVLALALSASAAGAVTFQIVAERGDVAPGTGGATFSFLGNPVLNDGGETAFLGILTGSGVTSANDLGVFTGASLVAREGDVAPGTGGATFSGFGAPALNDGGETAFSGDLTGSGVTGANDSGIFTGAGLVVRKGDVAPGTGGATFSFLESPALNDGGETAFRGFLTGAGVTIANDRGIFTGAGLVVQAGDVAPGTGGATFLGLNSVTALNDGGETAFVGILTGTGVTGANDEGIFTSAGLVARKGDVAPGTGGATFSSFNDPVLNNGGETAFRSDLTGTGVTGANDEGIFTDAGLVAREGDVAPGTSGATFLAFSDPALNDGGETAFSATFTGAGVTSANDSGIFTSDSSGMLSLIVREGDLIDLGGGDLRTVISFSPSRGALNTQGELAFLASFTGGSQAIVIADVNSAAVVPLPAPLALLLTGIAGLGLVARRRPRR